MFEIIWLANGNNFDNHRNFTHIAAWLAALDGRAVSYQQHMSTGINIVQESYSQFIHSLNLENHTLSYTFKGQSPQNIQTKKLVLKQNHNGQKLIVYPIDPNYPTFSFEEVTPLSPEDYLQSRIKYYNNIHSFVITLASQIDITP